MKQLGQCVRHPDEPALFRCRQCDDAVCVRCRAAGERDLCTVCGQYRQAASERDARVAAGEEPDPRPRSLPWGRYGIALLVILDLALAAYLVLATRPDNAVSRGMAGVRVVAGVLEESRDPSGHYPPSLAPILSRLPDPVAEMIRTDVIRYETDPGRTEYRLSLVLRPRPAAARRAD